MTEHDLIVQPATCYLISWCPMLCDWSVEVVRAEPQKLFSHHVVYHALQLNQLQTQMPTSTSHTLAQII